MSESDKILESTIPDNIDTSNVKIEQANEDKKINEDKKEDIKEENVSELKQVIKLIVKLHDDKVLYDEFLLNYNLKIDKKQFNNIIRIIGLLDNNINNKKFKGLMESIL
jgi:hypothetical protein